jgi:hypothetical protein
MASVKYLKGRKRWQIRKYCTHPISRQITYFYRMLPPRATRNDALTVAQEFDKQAHRIKYGQPQSPDQFDTALDLWLKLSQSHTARTYDLYERYIHRFADSLPAGLTSLTQIQPLHISSFIINLTDTLTAATANRHLTTIKSFCHWYSRQYALANPASAVDMLPEVDPVLLPSLPGSRWIQ